ncbi:protein phosphatase 1 regulatory subunit 12B isoform X2 [Phyllobates terribilis]|uniref:protein phosphatase 1 regulatory subunit 12B isoform X2 n=1 Tax=Phyllobates terribilis TaxID=111132 RepID=UPI003CCAA5AB
MLSACRAPDVPVIPVSRARPPLSSRSRPEPAAPVCSACGEESSEPRQHIPGTAEEPGCPPCTAAPRTTRNPGSLSRTLRPPPLHRRQRRFILDSGGSSLISTDSDRASTRARAYSRRDNRLPSSGNKTDEEPHKDFKKLYESAYNENEKLKSNLREAQQELADIKAKLERVVKKQDQSSSQVGLLEVEKREKRVLERKMSEMEDDLRALTDLKSDNQRLKDENGALIRVISKLSK